MSVILFGVSSFLFCNPHLEASPVFFSSVSPYSNFEEFWIFNSKFSSSKTIIRDILAILCSVKTLSTAAAEFEVVGLLWSMRDYSAMNVSACVWVCVCVCV